MEQPVTLINDPFLIFLTLLSVLTLVFWLSSKPQLEKFFNFVPPVFFAYFLPALLGTFKIIPSQSDFYSWTSQYILPMCILLLVTTIDIPAILKLGKKALLVMLAGTFGVIIGGPIAVFFFKSWLPEGAWMGLAALAGSWIGGVGNFAAIAASLEAPQSVISPAIIVDAGVGYPYMMLLILLSGYQARFNQWNKADTSMIDQVQNHLEGVAQSSTRPIKLVDILIVLCVGFGGGYLCFQLGKFLPTSNLFSPTLWGILIVTTVGILLSFTPMRKLEGAGSTKLANAALYLLLTTMGAKANLSSILEAPSYVAVGVVWLSIHALCLLIAARLLRAPMFFVAVGSMANIGGTISAPIVAEIYQKHMLTVGLLMALVGTILGNYGGLFCGYLMKLVTGG